jgi:hypothetical protein
MSLPISDRVPYHQEVANTGRMHQTTVRFGADLWEALERECERLGMSVAQYVREAALARLVYAAGRRGDAAFEAALEAAAESEPTAPSGDVAPARGAPFSSGHLG